MGQVNYRIRDQLRQLSAQGDEERINEEQLVAQTVNAISADDWRPAPSFGGLFNWQADPAERGQFIVDVPQHTVLKPVLFKVPTGQDTVHVGVISDLAPMGVPSSGPTEIGFGGDAGAIGLAPWARRKERPLSRVYQRSFLLQTFIITAVGSEHVFIVCNPGDQVELPPVEGPGFLLIEQATINTDMVFSFLWEERSGDRARRAPDLT